PMEWRRGIAAWTDQVQAWKRDKPLTYSQTAASIMPQAVIEKVSQLTQSNTVIVTDVGQHQMWTAQYYNFLKERSLLTSGGLGTMGYGLPAAIGAQMSLPKKTVILFTGDGSIMMNCQELATVADNCLPIKIIVINNQVLGMVNQWQRMFYGERYSHSSTKGNTDFVKLAEAMGVAGLRVSHPNELDSTLQKALQIEGPVLIDILVPPSEDVLPMVPPGGRLDQMVFGGID
ncbi:MAG: ilvI, partial [Sporomusa sp.]|nr:ilvI [Sporomusa sp.]